VGLGDGDGIGPNVLDAGPGGLGSPGYVGNENPGGGGGSTGTGWPGARIWNASGELGSVAWLRIAPRICAWAAVTGSQPASGVKSCPANAYERMPFEAKGSRGRRAK
jgi:hypothetical protein